MIVRMWEVRAHPRGFAELLTWVCDRAVPAVEVEPLHVSSEVFTSPDNRIVVISKWRSSPVPFADPPEKLVARAPHVWDFSPVDR
ncbi:hypothetical protein [Spirilliplanes yamanashiensis]|uniref:Uncharacterized protein n=1 Tax=Spirilliplanes yamanashiensis TaxID=42233 RepID=A0A8J3YAB6_9ACTN|nr:hypothetical protein [Spirilliplanes yamanashiensis]MDP9815931.1 hypothetical protein [Spirilliplanes yamanashiensis]GIJ04187.1 hypothetical protein Sya03_35390 [Spirilliplanes yamanashiensis]